MRKVLFLSLIAVVIGIGLLHFFTPGSLIFYHNTYRRLSYFPIVLGGIWFGVRGGMTMAVLSSIFFIPHVLLYLDKGPQAYLGELAEIILYLAAGLVVGIISARQTRLREKYRQLSEQLQASYARLHEETSQLIEAEKLLAAAQKFSALGKMSASLAHEIKNPLGSIKGAAEILADEFGPDHPKREFADIMLKETRRLQDTVDEVLRYSREPVSRQGTREPLPSVVQHVLGLVDTKVRDKGVSMQVEGLDACRDFLVEAGRLTQVLLNVILNAVDAVPPGGLVRVTLAPESEGCAMSVFDNGSGVDDALKERIFEPFFTGKEGGTGLGLLISRKIVEGLGGTIDVVDNPGGGACFRIFLPAAEPGVLPEIRGGH